MVFMEEQAERKEEGIQSGGLGGYVYWPGAILLLYVLSLGPVTKMHTQGVWKRPPAWLSTFYTPFNWAMQTPLSKPIGMYLHLWCPAWYDKNGDLIPLALP